MNLEILALVAASRSARQTIGSSGMVGEVQITLMPATVFWAMASGLAARRSMDWVLLVAASSTPEPTPNRLVSWLAERTVLKQAAGSIPLGANR